MTDRQTHRKSNYCNPLTRVNTITTNNNEDNNNKPSGDLYRVIREGKKQLLSRVHHGLMAFSKWPHNAYRLSCFFLCAKLNSYMKPGP